MLRDARNVSTGETLDADICIIGAGPAGITIARELIGSGASVLVLESGGLELDSEIMRLADGESVGRPYEPLFESRARAFGGTSHFWRPEKIMRSRPLDPIDFEARDEVPYSGWPFDLAELDPYYLRAHEVAALGDPQYDTGPFDGPGAEPLPLGDGDVHTTMFRFEQRMGVFSDYLPELEAAENVTVMHHANVVELVTSNDGSQVGHVDVAGLWTSAFRVNAKVFVLAAGGIENPRLLLASREHHTTGLGNEHDNVGRFFMEHLHVRTGVLTPRDPDLVDRLSLYERRIVDDWMVVGVLVATQSALRRKGLLNHAVYLRPEMPETTSITYRSTEVLAKTMLGRRPGDEDLKAHLRNVLRRPGEAAAITARRLAGRQQAPDVVQLTIQGEQAPNPSSRVTLSKNNDPLGFPRASLDWQLSDIDHQSIRGIQELVGAELSRAGIGTVSGLYGDAEPLPTIRGHWHHMGTTRMHNDRKLGVVDSDSRLHGVGNLFVAGSSVFPTCGYVNPTLTIVALALRLADHLKSGPLR